MCMVSLKKEEKSMLEERIHGGNKSSLSFDVNP